MASVILHLNLKNSLSFVVGGCVVALAVIPLWVPADHLIWVRWQTAIWIAVGVALASLFVQVCLQSKEDSDREQREKERDERSRITLKYLEQKFGPLTALTSPKTIEKSFSVDAVLVASTPRMYIDIKSQGKGLFYKTEIILSNHGGNVAHKVQIEPLMLRSGRITFNRIETLAAGVSKEIVATVENVSALFRHNISSILMKEWDAAGEVTAEFPLRMRILYEDFSHNKFETTLDLIYLPVQDIVEQNPFEIRNLEIRPLTQPAAP